MNRPTPVPLAGVPTRDCVTSLPTQAPTIRALTDYAEARDRCLKTIDGVLRDDQRVGAAWLCGSFGRGEADAWSDLDLRIAIDDAAFPSFLANLPALYEQVGHPILVQWEMDSSTMTDGRFQLVVYPGPVEVDWVFGPASKATRLPETQLLFDRIGVPVAAPQPLPPEERRARAERALIFFCAMAPIAVKYAARGDSRRASSQIDLLTGAFIPLWRLVERPDEPDPQADNTNRALEPELAACLPRLGWTIDPGRALHVIRELCAQVERLHPALTELGVPIPTDMPQQTAGLITIAEREIAQGERTVRQTNR